MQKWDVAPERNIKVHDHPAMFPEEIPYRLMRLFSYVDDIVLDPFNGVGTTTLGEPEGTRIGVFRQQGIQALKTVFLPNQKATRLG